MPHLARWVLDHQDLGEGMEGFEDLWFYVLYQSLNGFKGGEGPL